MAEKKSDKTDEELENDLFGDFDEDNSSKDGSSEVLIAQNEPIAEEIEEIIEEEEEKKDYKYLKARFVETKGDINRIEFLGASHGFLNLLTAKLIQEKGVKFSAYKETSIAPPILTVITDGTIPLKKILKNASVNMKKEIEELKKTVQATIK